MPPEPGYHVVTDMTLAADQTIQSSAIQPIIVVDRASKSYGTGTNAVTAVRDVSLTIQPGRSVALLGRSGSGKSTLLNLLGAVDRPTSGTIRIGSDDLSKMTDAQLALFRRRRLGFVFQSFHLVPSLTVFDNVAVPWTLDRVLTSQRKQEIRSLLDRLGVADKSGRYPDELSGGQQQRVALARAVVHRPAVVLADEPTGNLDAQTGRVILDLLDQLRLETGTTLIMATHSEEAATRCQQRVTLSDGGIVVSN